MKASYKIAAIVILFVVVSWLFRKQLQYFWYYTKAFLTPQTWDPGTDAEIAFLHPFIRSKVVRFINQVEKQLGIQLRIIDGFRSFLEQQNLYDKGRLTNNDIVTNALPGESYHNYGLAFDVESQQSIFDKQWKQIAALAEQFGFRWGGNFNSIADKPHFEYNQPLHHSKLLALYQNNQTTNGFVNLKLAA